MSHHRDLKERVAHLCSSLPRSPLQIAQLLGAPLSDVADAILTLVSEQRIYTFTRGPGERFYLRKRPLEACLTWEERELRYEARTYSKFYENNRGKD